MPEESDGRPISRYGSQKWAEYLAFIRDAPECDRKTLLKEYGLLGQSWVASGRSFLVFSVPIATQSTFYGYFLAFVPPANNDDADRELKDKVWSSLARLARDLYVPVLTLLAESVVEEDLSDGIRKAPGEEAAADWKGVARQFISDRNVPFLYCAHDRDPEKRHEDCPSPERGYDKAIELPLHRLWVRRQNMLSRMQETRWPFLGTLPFADYYVASPGLLKLLKDVMKEDFTIPQERKALQAALVYGGPGSGKDIMARLIPLFSEEYFYHEVHTVNMAAVRPDVITGPLLQGIQLSIGDGQAEISGPQLVLDGLFAQAKRREMKAKLTLQDVSSGSPEEKPAPAATFILDELNSLDVDLQGILLRIIEQGEVMSLFGLRKEYVQHLVIGIVNEDPEEISRESDLKSLLVEKGKLGTLISSLIYETLRRMRRLREDLYHRLRRSLYVRLPEVKDRPEDIPMLFFVSARGEAKRFKLSDKLIVNLDAYKLLMHPRFLWPGNVRQIQAVARSSVKAAKEAYDSVTQGPSPKANLVVTSEHVLKVLKDEFKGVRLDGSAGKDETGSRS